MGKVLYDYELWSIDDTPLLKLSSDNLLDEYYKSNGILLCKFSAFNCFQACLIRDRYLKIGDYQDENQPYEIWVDKSKDRESESVKILLPTSRPRKHYIDMSKYKCIKVIEATNDTDGINLCRDSIGMPRLSKKLKGLFS